MQNNLSNPQELDFIEEDEIDLRELFTTINENKIVIFLVTMFVVLSATIYLYFQPITYESSNIIELKTQQNKKTSPQEMLFNTFNGISNDEIDKQLEILKTYSVNKQVLEQVPFEVQYFQKDGLKQKELFDNAPITITDINIKDKNILSKNISIIPVDEEYFKLNIYKKEFFPWSKKTLSEKKYPYSKLIDIGGIEFKLFKTGNFKQPCNIKFNGSYRDIYEKIIKSSLSISRTNKSSTLIKISFRDKIPKRAEIYVDKLSELFLRDNIVEKLKKNTKTINSITSQLQKIKDSLNKSEYDITNYKITNNISKPKEQSAALINKISKIDLELTHAKLRYKTIQDIYNSMVKNKDYTSIELSLSELGDKKISMLFNTLQSDKVKESELSLDFKDTYPELIKIRKKINRTQSKILKSIKSLKTTMGNSVKGLKNAKQKAQNIIKTLPEKETQLTNYNRQYSVDSEMYIYLLRLKSEKTIARASIESDFKIIDKAYTNLGTKKPKEKLIIVVSAITGLILGIFLTFLKEFLTDNIQNFKNMQNIINLPIYGYIPLLKTNERVLAIAENIDGGFTESFREVRNNIRTNYHYNRSNIIMVNSTVPSEGKTTVVANLATILSMADFKTIIINLDLRKPMLHRYYNIKNDQGISNYLLGESSYPEIIHKTKFANIDVIPAGKMVPNPSELLLKQHLQDLLIYLKTKYDYILVDTAPIGLVTDNLHLINYVDLNLFVMREGVSRKSHISTIHRLIKENRIDNAAIVLNGIKEINSKYYNMYNYEISPTQRLKSLINKNSNDKISSST